MDPPQPVLLGTVDPEVVASPHASDRGAWVTSYSMSAMIFWKWERVADAFWRKYPSPLLPHIEDAHLLDRRIEPESGALVTKRVMCVKQAIPPILRAFVMDAGSLGRSYALEETVVDPAKRTLTVTTRNLSFSRVLDARSLAVYRPDPENEKTQTLYELSATVMAKVYPRMVAKRAEFTLAGSSLKNSRKGLDVLDLLCRELEPEARSS